MNLLSIVAIPLSGLPGASRLWASLAEGRVSLARMFLLGICAGFGLGVIWVLVRRLRGRGKR